MTRQAQQEITRPGKVQQMEKAFAAIETQVPAFAPPTVIAESLAAGRKKERPSAFGKPREFLGNRFVYAVVSQRAHGLSIGVNVNPDKTCNFACPYCEVNRDHRGFDSKVDLDVLATELRNLLTRVGQGKLRELPCFATVPQELLTLTGVALSGDGEPTLSPQFAEIVRELICIRSQGEFPFFKLVIITNGTGLDLPEVKRGLNLLTAKDEIWVKFEAGTQEYMDRVNRTSVRLEKILANILLIGRQRPVIIQSLFPSIHGSEPAQEEIELYVQHLLSLRKAGAQIPLVQIYSAHRPSHNENCGHLPLKSLSRIAQRVRDATGIRAEVF
jgi:wyosine [tRNA(Phe)-imidazoG37] synthetase (radical SAM superfamily)